MNRSKFLLSGALGFVVLAGLGAVTAQNHAAPEVTKAVAVLNPTEGSRTKGVVTFTKAGDKVKVVADIEGLTPGKHGFHIHEFGDCSAKDAMSAGGHFNPHAVPHGAPDVTERHPGDMGNIEPGPDGKARVELTDSVMKLDGASSIIGRAVMIHAQADDLKSQPTGNAGARHACGAIGVAKP
jgi:Cu-Zn family superoxide dismutase